MVEGMPLSGGKYLHGALGWFSSFLIMTGMALVFGYALLGSTWLMFETDGRPRRVARDLTRPLMLAVIAFVVMVSAWLPFLDSRLILRAAFLLADAVAGTDSGGRSPAMAFRARQS